ncbi:hypothetical protein [Brevundimonas sp.]|uniref:hypothetical protein n=1 Tax=Brevundimonas sp. TaxID=1871086 RepID=UPI0035ADAB7C
MSDYGIRVTNTHGSIQIGQDFTSLALSTWGTVNLVDDGGAHPQPLVWGQVTVTGTFPRIAFRPPVGKEVCLWKSANPGSGSTWTFTFMCQSSTPFSLEYWVFDHTSRSPWIGEDWGVRVRKANGEVAFHHANRPVRIVGALTIPEPPETFGQGHPGGLFGYRQTVTQPSGAKYAIVQGTRFFANATYDMSRDGLEMPVSNPNYKWMGTESYWSMGTVNASGHPIIGIGRYEFWQGETVNSTPESRAVHGGIHHWVIDVTNYPSGSTSPPVPSPVVTVNATTRSVSGSTLPTTSAYATASATGGSGSGYQYQWQFVDGDTAVAAYGSTTSASLRTRMSTGHPGTRTARFRCRVTDSAGGVGFSPEVTFQHNYAPMMNPPTVTLPAQEKAVHTTPWPADLSHTHSRTSTVSSSVSGGTAPLTYSWARQSGSTLIQADAPISGSSMRWNVPNTSQCNERAIWRLTVTDANGQSDFEDIEVWVIRTVDLVIEYRDQYNTTPNTTLVEVTRTGAGASNTPPTDFHWNGGHGGLHQGYTSSWARISGSSSVAQRSGYPSNPSGNTSRQSTSVTGQSAGTTLSSVLRLTVTANSTEITKTHDVTFRHVATGAPAALSATVSGSPAYGFADLYPAQSVETNTVEITASGGTGSYTYSWNYLNGVAPSIEQPQFGGGPNVRLFKLYSPQPGFYSGTVRVTISDGSTSITRDVTWSMDVSG